MSNIVELLTLFLEKVTPSKDLTTEQWTNLVSTVKNTLDNSKDYISNSADPLVEGFSTILNAFVSNKYSTPGSNYYSALTLSRIGSFSSHSSTDSNISNTPESDSNHSHSLLNTRGFLDRLKDDDKSSNSSRSSSESSGRRKGYSALVGTLKKLFLKEKLERLESKRSLDNDNDTKYKDTKEIVDVHSDDKKGLKRQKLNYDKNTDTTTHSSSSKEKEKQQDKQDKDSSRDNEKDRDKDRESKDSTISDEQPFVRDPYPLRSNSPRPGSGKQIQIGKIIESPKRSTRDINMVESTRITFRDEMADKIPPLDLELLKPHDHLTTPGDSENTSSSFLTTIRNKLENTVLYKDDNKKDTTNKEKGDDIDNNKEDVDKENKDEKHGDNKNKKNKEKDEDNSLSKKRERTGITTDSEHETKHQKSKTDSPKVVSPKRQTNNNTVNKSKTQISDKVDLQGETDIRESTIKDNKDTKDNNNKEDKSKEKEKQQDKQQDKDSSRDNEKDRDMDKDNKNKENEKNKEKDEEIGEFMSRRIRDDSKDILYKPLITLVDNVTRVDLYVVAVEMIRASVRTIDIRRDVFNYRAIDPSVLHNNNNVDYSVQIMSSDPKMAHHINFGDVLRLKRVDANFVIDKSGRKHINIILSLKNRPSMRLWHLNQNKELETERINIDFNKVTDSTRMGLTYNNTNNNNNHFNSYDNSERSSSGFNNWLNSNSSNDSNNTNNRDNNNKDNNNNTSSNSNNKEDGDKENKDMNKDRDKDNKDTKDNNNKEDKSKEKEKQQDKQDTTTNIKDNNRESSSRVRSPMLRDYELDPETVGEQIELLKKEAVVVFYDAKVTMTAKDVAIINFLKDWSKNLKPLDILGSSEYTKPLTESSNIPQDFIVKVIKVFPDQSLMVADTEAKAIVSNFEQILASNLFETCNPIQKGDWLKLRCFIRVFNESDRLIKLSATKFSCVTRIPPINRRVTGEEHLNPENNHGILVRERRVNLEELSRTSCLNDSFPRRFKRSRDFIHKLLSKQPPVQFQKASPVRIPVEKEEGEISQ